MKLNDVIRKITAVFLCAAVTAASAVSAPAAPKFESAEAAAENITVGWNLGNTLDSCGEWIGLYTEGKPENYETAWGNPAASRELIAAVKAAGFNAI